MFEMFFQNVLSVNHKVYLNAVGGALEQLRLYDLGTNHQGEGSVTYPLQGHWATYKLAEDVGSLVGERGQKLPIGSVKWIPEEFMVQESDGGVAMVVMLKILQWGKEKDLLSATLSAYCRHDEVEWVHQIGYAMTVILVLTAESQATVVERTSGKVRELYHSMLNNHSGGKVLLARDPMRGVDDGREGNYDLTDEI